MKKNTTFIRAWAKRKKREDRYIKEFNPELLFNGFVYSFSRFGQNWPSLDDICDVP
jgi:hypothetical protein